ncbi:MAG: transglycosylase domain-containing protein [Pseudomonadota bacterium]
MSSEQGPRPKLVAEKRKFEAAQPKNTAPQKKPRKKKTPKDNPVFRGIKAFFKSILLLLWWIGSRCAVVLAIVIAVATFYYLSFLPAPEALMDDRSKGSVTMLDQNGDVFAWRGDQFGGIVTAETVSPHLKNAVIATEDKRFYRHLGISPRGIASAVRINLREGRKPWEGNGGSTITQQIAKRIFFEDLPAIERKIKEVPMAFAMELKYTKDEILAIYLNRAFLGNGSFGFEAASQRYFGKSARQVGPAESAMLAGLLKAPSSTNPIRNPDRAARRANLIVGLMEDQGYLTQTEANIARDNPARLSQAAAERAGGYFADWILETTPDFLINDAKSDIVIQTTFDKRIQRAAEAAMAKVFTRLKEGSRVQGAIVVMTRDGAVKGMVGGRSNALAGSFNRATQALRQTGSSFKPFVYAAGLENGLRYDSIIEDSPITIGTPSGPWTPKNYTRDFKGPITATQALAESINTVAVKVSENTGRERVRAVARDFGIISEIPSVPAMALGAAESTLLEMTGAYAGILNRGVARRPHGLVKLTIQGEAEPLLSKDEGENGTRVINELAAGQLTYMMMQVVTSGTGGRANLGARDAAGKTGTTQGARDAWFIGFTADYVAGVWMGYDDNTKLTCVTGGGMPAEIWKETMLGVHDGLPLRPLQIELPAPVGGNSGTNGRVSIEDEIKRLEDEIKDDLKKVEDGLKRGIGKIFRDIFN